MWWLSKAAKPPHIVLFATYCAAIQVEYEGIK